MCLKLLKYAVFMFSVSFFSVLSVSAQVISARAGVVKKVDGEVFYRCHDNKRVALKLSNNSLLHNEDTVVTTESGSMVLALNPDSYLYIDADAFIEVKNTELNKMHFDIERGQIVLFIRSLKNGASLVIHTPPGVLTIRKGGRYLISVGKDGNTKANVIRGELGYFDQGELMRLKKGRQVDFIKKIDSSSKKAASENR